MEENQEQQELNVMELKIKDLVAMILREKGSFADFTVKDKVNDEVLAFIAIGLFDVAEKLKDVFYEALDGLEESDEEAEDDEQ
jgi:hypothetical protein